MIPFMGPSLKWCVAIITLQQETVAKATTLCVVIQMASGIMVTYDVQVRNFIHYQQIGNFFVLLNMIAYHIILFAYSIFYSISINTSLQCAGCGAPNIGQSGFSSVFKQRHQQHHLILYSLIEHWQVNPHSPFVSTNYNITQNQHWPIKSSLITINVVLICYHHLFLSIMISNSIFKS